MKMIFALIILSSSLFAQITPIIYRGDARVEVGNYYIGIESHHNFPMLQRISFYYPSANSIDLSKDYWKRDSTFCMAASITEDGHLRIINTEKYDLRLTPYSAVYHKNDSALGITVSYQFCKDEPAMVNTYTIKNNSGKSKNVTLHTHLETSLRTSHSYKLKDSASVFAVEEGEALVTQYLDPETQFAEIFTANAGEMPKYKYNESVFAKDEYHWWKNTGNEPPSPQTGSLAKPAAGYLYEKIVEPGHELKVVQIIGSCRVGESKSLIPKLITGYQEKVNTYEKFITAQINKNRVLTSDSIINETTLWSKAILETNQHYIDSTIQPMPCPAEYNFYFTHDVLLTDLAVVNYNISRVKKDLEFIVQHSDKSYIIPHAYYWKDTAFVTEYATTDNWNHFWFVLVSGTYLRHSNDVKFLGKLYPYLTKSIEQAMQNEKDNLMWAYRPDWWDIGRNYGPRSFMTILAIKALREYVYISSVLNRNTTALTDYSEKADKLQQNLNEILWSNEQNYLINYFENNVPDKHYYIGSLLGSAFDLISPERKNKLTETAGKYLLDEKIGIYNVYPMDFHKLIEFLRFAGDEAGQPHKYANGGVWPHGNAWYALALISAGKKDEAFNFIKTVTTLNGIINSPNGQPAMYEYRVSNNADPKEYGKIDKPQFMWAAGWYIYTLYHLLAVEETEWNIKFNPYLNDDLRNAELPLILNGKKYNVRIEGRGETIREIKLNGKDLNSYIIPETEDSGSINIILGDSKEPLLLSAGSRVLTCSYEPDRIRIKLAAFKGKKIEVLIKCPVKPLEIYINKNLITDYSFKDNVLKINFIQENSSDLLTVWFNK